MAIACAVFACSVACLSRSSLVSAFNWPLHPGIGHFNEKPIIVHLTGVTIADPQYNGTVPACVAFVV